MAVTEDYKTARERPYITLIRADRPYRRAGVPYNSTSLISRDLKWAQVADYDSYEQSRRTTLTETIDIHHCHVYFYIETCRLFTMAIAGSLHSPRLDPKF